MQRASHRFLLFSLVSFLTIVAPFTALAQERNNVDIPSRIEECVNINDRVRRLVCYDNLAKELGLITEETAESTEELLHTAGFWEFIKKRGIAGDETFYLKNKTIEPIVSSAGIDRYPTLNLRCRLGTTNVFLDWGNQFDVTINQRKVFLLDFEYQFDSEPAKIAKWEISTDRRALFSPQPVDFVKEMRQHERLVIDIAPPQEVARTLVFDLRGINEVLKVLVKECYN